jgi:hypothetical protein
MEIGKYSRKKIDFHKFEVRRFPLTLFDPELFGLAGCYANMLASLVGKEDPFKIKALNKNMDSGDDKFCVSYLKKNGFVVVPITKCLMSDRGIYEGVLEDKIKKYNIVISSSLVRRNEASWFIAYQNMWLHNQVFLPMKHLDMINCPIDTCYLLWHEKYK